MIYMNIDFYNKKYELLFSNNLLPLSALNYADELFFKEFKKLCGKKYRILSIIKNGWQEKYGLNSDMEILRDHFFKKINNYEWPDKLLRDYLKRCSKFHGLLDGISKVNFKKCENNKIKSNLANLRTKAAPLDAMSNMLYLFSVLVGEEFLQILKRYTSDNDILNKNFIYYTQPIKESRYAKIKIKKLKIKIKLTKFEQNFSKILRVGAFIKDDVSHLLELRNKKMKKMFLEISKRLDCGADDLNYLQIKEIQECLSGKELNRRLITKRKKIAILFYQNDKLSITEGAEAKKFLKIGGFRLIKEREDKTKELLGQIACPGKVKGTAVLAQNNIEANKKMNQGNILVAPYTAVEYLPAMKKAAALITETGGITSHAAIVSRELKIPCIIGVKGVMDKLRDGYIIEVDANRGVVKILKN